MIKTNFFDGGGISYTATDMVAPMASLLVDGVFNVILGALAVNAHNPAGLNVDISAGSAIKNGYYINSDAIENVAIVANTSGYNRIDLIVANVDKNNKVTSFQAIQGTPNSSPTMPIPASNQLPLAQVFVGNNVSVINQLNITDLRANVDTNTQQTYSKFRQAIINGNFDVWQRGTSFTNSASAYFYTADRWWVSMGTNPTTGAVTVSQMTPQGSELNSQSARYLRWNMTTAGTTANNQISQKLEDVRTFAGQTVTVSFMAKADAAGRPLWVGFDQNFGAGGSPAISNVAKTSVFSLSTSWQRYTATVNIPSIAGKTVASGAYLRMYFYFPDATVCTIDIAQVQLNLGPVALPFMAKTFGEEMLDCKRFFEMSYGYGNAIGATNSDNGRVFEQGNSSDVGNFYSIIRFQVTKRTNPTVTCYDYGTGASNKVFFTKSGGNGTTITPTVQYITPDSAEVVIGAGANWTPSLMIFQWVADAEL